MTKRTTYESHFYLKKGFHTEFFLPLIVDTLDTPSVSLAF